MTKLEKNHTYPRYGERSFRSSPSKLPFNSIAARTKRKALERSRVQRGRENIQLALCVVGLTLIVLTLIASFVITGNLYKVAFLRDIFW